MQSEVVSREEYLKRVNLESKNCWILSPLQRSWRSVGLEQFILELPELNLPTKKLSALFRTLRPSRERIDPLRDHKFLGSQVIANKINKIPDLEQRNPDDLTSNKCKIIVYIPELMRGSNASALSYFRK